MYMKPAAMACSGADSYGRLSKDDQRSQNGAQNSKLLLSVAGFG